MSLFDEIKSPVAGETTDDWLWKILPKNIYSLDYIHVDDKDYFVYDLISADSAVGSSYCDRCDPEPHSDYCAYFAHSKSECLSFNSLCMWLPETELTNHFYEGSCVPKPC